MRKVIDWVLTVNLVLIMGVVVYWWYTGQLIITFQEPQVAAVADTEVTRAFETTLKMEVDRVLGVPEAGYTPDLFLQVFPGLVHTDFAGVEASLGRYQIENGRSVLVMPAGQLRYANAGSVSFRGMATLLDNVSTRLGIDLQNRGTITEVMLAISER